jgi:phage major head subunit gpT-like protein
MRRWVGGRDAKRLLTESITLLNEKFETTLVDTRENWQYDKTGQLNTRLNDLVTRTMTHWNKLASELLVAGTSTLTYDGQNFFSASHSFGLSGTLKNLLTSSEVSALNVTTPANPTPAEMADAIYGVINYFYTFKDDVGEPINEGAERFMVVVPANLAAPARTAATKAVLTNAVGSLDNPLLGSGFTIDVVPNPRLTATDAFYTLREDGSLKPFVLQQRGPVRLTAKAEGSDFEHDTDQWEFGASAERQAGLFGWQSAAKATLS